MKINPYFLVLLGESRSDVESLHHSSITRLKAYAVAMHIPLFLWVLTGYVVASRIFQLGQKEAVLAAIASGVLVYLIERVVIATPKGWTVTLLRLVLGMLMAMMGSAMVDLVLFDKEIGNKLQTQAERRLRAEQLTSLRSQAQRVEENQDLWLEAQSAANCEANGTCGSGVKSTGPIYRVLAEQADTARSDYLEAQAKLDVLEQSYRDQLQALKDHGIDTTKVGVLARLEALHHYIVNTKMARLVWATFFALIVLMELMVVIVKVIFPSTADDLIREVVEAISEQKARDYHSAVLSPFVGARELLRSENG